jgi:hypothetical protein
MLAVRQDETIRIRSHQQAVGCVEVQQKVEVGVNRQ